MLALCRHSHALRKDAGVPADLLIDLQGDPRIARAFQAYVEACQRAAVSGEAASAMLAGAAADVVDAIPWDALAAGLRADMVAALEDLANASANRATAATGAGFLLTNPHAVEWAAKYSAQLVTLISDQTESAIRALVANAIDVGVPPAELARSIRDMIGPNVPQQEHLSKLVEGWFSDGRSWWEVDKLIDAQVRRMVAARATMIARTELTTAQARGLIAGWRTAGEAGFVSRYAVQVWIAALDERCTSGVCHELNGKLSTMGGVFRYSGGTVSAPAVHPLCRCTLGMRTLSPDEFQRAARENGWRIAA